MPKKLGEFINDLALKAGITADNADLKGILANPTLAATEVSDAIASQIDSNLMTEEAAKHNPNLKKYYHAQVLNGIDAEHKAIFEEMQFDAATVEEIKKEASTYKREGLIARKIKELEEKKAAAKSGDKGKLQEEITSLNKQLADLKDSTKKEVEAARKQADDDVTLFAIQSQLAAKNYAYDLPKDVNVSTAYNLLDADLKNKKLKVVRNADKTLKLVTETDTDYHENHKPVSFGDYVDKLLGTHKLLKVSNPPDPKNPPNPPFVPPGNKVDNSKVTSAIDKQLAEIEASANGLK